MNFKMKKKALQKDIFMEIKKSLPRFISLALIVALGVAFFSGIRATKPDMELSADNYYDESNLMDIRVLGTLGLTEKDAWAVEKVEGVREVMPAYSFDVTCKDRENQLVVKLLSLPDMVNKVQLSEGRFPVKAGECLVDNEFLKQTDYNIGDTIFFESGTQESLEDVINRQEFTIVGTGSTSYYLSVEIGTSSIGGGWVDSFAMILKEDFALEAYTEFYVTAVGAADKMAYTKEYDEHVEKTVEKITEIADSRCQLRYEEVQTEGKEKIQEGEEEIQSGEEKLEEAERELEEGEKELLDGKKEFEENKEKLQDGKRELEENKKELISGKEQLEEGFARLEEGKAELTSAKHYLNVGNDELAYQKGLFYQGKAEFEAQEKAYAAMKEEALKEINKNKELLLYLESLPESGEEPVRTQIEQLSLGIRKAEEELAAADTQMEQTRQELEVNESRLYGAEQELKAGEQELKKAEEELVSSNALLLEKEAELRSGEEALKAAEKKLKEGETEFEKADKLLKDSEKELEEGKEKYEKAKKENEGKLAKAQKDIEQAKKDLAQLEIPEWYVLDRNSLQSYVGYGQDAERIGAIGEVFPAIFFLVAALVSLTTMTRMVEEERIQIGTLKALGYSKLDIAKKYIFYALSASLLGSLIGLVAGQKFLPVVIIQAYKVLYNNLPKMYVPLNLEYSITSTLLAVACTTTAAIFSCYKELAAHPAGLMRPAAPKAGKRVILEKIPFIWNSLNFTKKATVRNLLRYKKRFFMTVFGISGCMALLLLGFGIRDSIVSIVPIQFGEIEIYDGVFGIEGNADDKARENLYNKLREDSRITGQLHEKEMAVNAVSGDKERSCFLTVVEEPEELNQYVVLRDGKTKEPIKLDNQGVVITQKLSVLLDAEIGDTLYLEEDGEKVEVRISGISENYSMHYVYMSKELYEKTYGEIPVYNKILTRHTETGESFEKGLQSDYGEADKISSITFLSGVSERIEDTLESMNTVVYVLIVSAGLLAFVVLYNLNNININERKRELATLKVLGFYDNETARYVYRENTLLTMIGVVTGAFLGILLHRFVIVTVEIDMMMFGRNIDPISYLYSIGLTFLFSFLVNFVMYYKLKRIDMIESLKSVE